MHYNCTYITPCACYTQHTHDYTHDYTEKGGKIFEIAQLYGQVKCFNAYADMQLQVPAQDQMELQRGGVTLCDTPHAAQKSFVDKHLLVDMCLFVSDLLITASTTTISSSNCEVSGDENVQIHVLLVSSSEQLASCLHELKKRGVNIIVCAPQQQQEIQQSQQSQQLQLQQLQSQQLQCKSLLSAASQWINWDRVGMESKGSRAQVLRADYLHFLEQKVRHAVLQCFSSEKLSRLTTSHVATYLTGDTLLMPAIRTMCLLATGLRDLILKDSGFIVFKDREQPDTLLLGLSRKTPRLANLNALQQASQSDQHIVHLLRNEINSRLTTFAKSLNRPTPKARSASVHRSKPQLFALHTLGSELDMALATRVLLDTIKQHKNLFSLLENEQVILLL